MGLDTSLLEGDFADPKKRKARAKVTLVEEVDDEDEQESASVDDFDESMIKAKKSKVSSELSLLVEHIADSSCYREAVLRTPVSRRIGSSLMRKMNLSQTCLMMS